MSFFRFSFPFSFLEWKEGKCRKRGLDNLLSCVEIHVLPYCYLLSFTLLV